MALFKVSPRFGAFQAQAVGHTVCDQQGSEDDLDLMSP